MFALGLLFVEDMGGIWFWFGLGLGFVCILLHSGEHVLSTF